MKRTLGLRTLLLGSLLLSSCATAPTPSGLFLPATVSADCAPWDGAAFTISIPYAQDSLYISIWRSADIPTASRFSFPDATGRSGAAIYQTSTGQVQALRGRVNLGPVNKAHPIEGEFDLQSESGLNFSGRFSADWDRRQTYCG